MSAEETDFVFDRPAPPKCKHCGRLKGNHQAKTLACPIGRGNFPHYSTEQTYAPRAVRANAAAVEGPAAAEAEAAVSAVEGRSGRHPRPQVMVDAVLLTLVEGRLQVALHERERAPEQGKLGLPGGAVHVAEDANTEATIRRVLLQKTGFQPRYLEQLQVFSGPTRDPGGWSISVAYVALVPEEELDPKGGSVFLFYDVDDLPEVAFDHAEIIRAAVARVRNKSSYSTLPFMLLPEKFTLPQLQSTYEAVLQTKLDKSSFRRKLEALDVVLPLPEFLGGEHRPAQLYVLKDFALFDKTLG